MDRCIAALRATMGLDTAKMVCKRATRRQRSSSHKRKTNSRRRTSRRH